jgi:hypothetical protein
VSSWSGSNCRADVAEVAEPVGVGVGVVAVHGRAGVALVAVAVVVDVELLEVLLAHAVVAGVAHPVLVGVGLAGIGEGGAHVARVAHPVGVPVELERIGVGGTEVARVAELVGVGIGLVGVERGTVVARVPGAVAVGVRLVGVAVFGAVVAREGDRDVGGRIALGVRQRAEAEAVGVLVEREQRIEAAERRVVVVRVGGRVRWIAQRVGQVDRCLGGRGDAVTIQVFAGTLRTVQRGGGERDQQPEHDAFTPRCAGPG